MTSPLSPEAVAQMVADLTTKAAMISMGEKIAWGSDSGVMDAAADMITTLSAENATLRARNEELRDEVTVMSDLLHTAVDEIAGGELDDQEATIATLRASEAAALERVSNLISELQDFEDGWRQCGCGEGCKGRHEERDIVLDALNDVIAAALTPTTYKE